MAQRPRQTKEIQRTFRLRLLEGGGGLWKGVTGRISCIDTKGGGGGGGGGRGGRRKGKGCKDYDLCNIGKKIPFIYPFYRHIYQLNKFFKVKNYPESGQASSRILFTKSVVVFVKIVSVSSDGQILVWRVNARKGALELTQGFLLLASNLPATVGQPKAKGHGEMGGKSNFTQFYSIWLYNSIALTGIISILTVVFRKRLKTWNMFNREQQLFQFGMPNVLSEPTH